MKFSEYDIKIARQQLTLATIAKSGEGTEIGNIRSIIIQELAKQRYATNAEWELAWGPIIGAHYDNLVFVVRNTVTSAYSIVLRATMANLESWWEDIPRKQAPFPYVDDDQALVSSHFLKAFEGMLNVHDASGFSLTQFMEVQIRQHANAKIYVTGHSQGASLVSLMLAWLTTRLTQWDVPEGAEIIGYASAAPTPGNPDFANWINTHCDCKHTVNPLDTIPFWYGTIDQVIQDNIPVTIPDSIAGNLIRSSIKAWAKLADDAGEWGHSLPISHLGKVQLPDTIGYFEQVRGQHTENSYLYLLGAPPVDTANASPLPPYGPPVAIEEA